VESESISDNYRNDGALVNLFTGMGVAGKDKKLENRVTRNHHLDEYELEELYQVGLIRRYVDAIPEAVMRHMPTVQIATEEEANQEIVSSFETFLKNTGFHSALREVMQLQRIYGGAGLVLLIDDGLAPEEPVNINRIRGIRGYMPLSRHELIPEDYSFNDYSKPTWYRVTTNQKLEEEQSDQYLNFLIHNSRVARFDGLYLPWNVRARNTGWGQSVIEVIWDAWQDYSTALHGLGSLVGEGDLLVHQIPGLMQRIAAGGEADIRKRLELNNLARSVYGAMVVDREENLTNLSRNLSNISTATEPFIRHLQAATGWPASILMGDSPGGLGKEGRFEERVWASLVEQWQEVYCRSSITEIFQYIFLSREGPTKGKVPENWEVEFPSVFTETEKEKAELRDLVSRTDNTYAQLGVLNPLEIRESRFGGTNYSTETVLNEAITEQLLVTTEAEFQNQLLSLQAQQEAAAQGGLPPEDEEASDFPEEDDPEEQIDERTKTDSFETYKLRGLKIRITNELKNYAVKAGYLVGPDGQRLDSSTKAPLMIFGPHRSKAYKIYRARFTRDAELVEGPFATGFASLRAAKAAVSALFPGQTVAGLSPIPEDEATTLCASWEAY
jgi:phage-related protein (TIGR01555 family)